MRCSVPEVGLPGEGRSEGRHGTAEQSNGLQTNLCTALMKKPPHEPLQCARPKSSLKIPTLCSNYHSASVMGLKKQNGLSEFLQHLS